jgi:predicted secreted Zn-dependent protease
MTHYTVTITDNETKQKQTIILLKMLTEIVDEYEASDVTFDRVKLAKGGD